MLTFLKQYIIALIIFLLIDSIWLLVIAKNLYQNELGSLMAKNPNLIAALIFYLLFIFGLVYFVINPGIEINSITKILINGIIFGLVTYATYDLTSLAVIQNFSLKVTIIDLIWGIFISVSTSVITFYIFKVFS